MTGSPNLTRIITRTPGGDRPWPGGGPLGPAPVPPPYTGRHRAPDPR